ncbi:hypothetical protein [Bacillus sp. EAC]|uniref:hypothetical protein n=1 Tax=Bacillus sp. EAC TaxID=1978338 RepID=UPI000B438C42|nr:hypothetical protein [Bacillus sp. EAC]
MKKINVLFAACIMVLAFSFSIPVSANSYSSQQVLKSPSKAVLSSKQSSMKFALRRSYRSNRSYRPSAPRSSYRSSRNTSRNFLGYAGAFGIGSLFGSMLHPFGGYFGGQQFGFSFFSLLIDILLIIVIIWFIKKIFRRSGR